MGNKMNYKMMRIKFSFQKQLMFLTDLKKIKLRNRKLRIIKCPHRNLYLLLALKQMNYGSQNQKKLTDS